MKNLAYILSAGDVSPFSQGVSAPHKAGLRWDLGSPLQSPFQGPKRDFKNRNRNGQGPLERQVRLGSSSGFQRAHGQLDRRWGGPAHSDTLARSNRLRQPLDAQPSLRGPLRPGSSDRRTPAGARPESCCGFAPRAERARGAGPRGSAGGSAGRAGREARQGPARRGTGARSTAARPLSFHALGLPRAAVIRPGTAGRRRLSETPGRAPTAPAGRRAGPRRAARAPHFPPPPRPRPQRAAAARWRLSPRARRPPAPRWIFVVAKLRRRLEGRRAVHRPGAAAAPSGRRAEGPAGSLFYLPGIFRARPRSIARFPSRSFSFFLSFFSSPRAESFFPLSAAHALARSRPPSCWAPRAAARQLSRPHCPRSGGRRRRRRSAPTHSNMARAQGRMRPRPLHSALLRRPAPLARRA